MTYQYFWWLTWPLIEQEVFLLVGSWNMAKRRGVGLGIVSRVGDRVMGLKEWRRSMGMPAYLEF